MADVAALVGKLRGEEPPATPYHPAIERRKLRADLRKLDADSGTEESVTEVSGP